MIGFLIFIVGMLVVAILFLLNFPKDIWWISLVPFGFCILGVICFLFFIRSTRKKLNMLEKELKELKHSASELNK
ncbi:TPA: phage holin family protein [Candidatus Scatousia excrementigallinarum]|uniref:Phage holin family protein n=1 Tax=Candidatus Scatousia excrementigallinarum TaxID=2840935 RepID=A0A9D1EXD0_9BACT|nr:phage holin family protein [Candidatus Scatousia excrementigallinarum]